MTNILYNIFVVGMIIILLLLLFMNQINMV